MRHLETLAAFDESVSSFEEADRAWRSNTADVNAIRRRQEVATGAGVRRSRSTTSSETSSGGCGRRHRAAAQLASFSRSRRGPTAGLVVSNRSLAFLPLHAAGRGSQWLHATE